ncbi:hypothetical protein [Moritella viscosa]|nr:hypothetical protein [Moritella viscosa]
MTTLNTKTLEILFDEAKSSIEKELKNAAQVETVLKSDFTDFIKAGSLVCELGGCQNPYMKTITFICTFKLDGRKMVEVTINSVGCRAIESIIDEIKNKLKYELKSIDIDKDDEDQEMIL